jgi:DNA-binding NtrC family response regulator
MTQNVTLHTQQITAGDRVVALRRRKLRLEVVAGPDKKLRRDVDADRIVIGTHPSCDLPLTDRTVSRQHCEIVLARSGYVIRDLDSTNGTWIDKTRVFEVAVDHECRLRVGDTTVRLAPTDDTVDLPLASETRFGPLLGRSAAMRRVFDLLGRIAPSDLNVLLLGESGTGKELAARAIHGASRRANGPFVVVDCGALPATLIESELYGHERGAFTGADRSRTGAFETASGGTLFLDEIGELSLDLQTRLLGVIERRRVQPLGSNESRAIDVRVVAATNRDLRREVNRGAFREDLYFRLAVAIIELPPLRERPEDIPLYVEELLADLAPAGFTVDAAAMQKLMERRWPGNVRELRNFVERAVALGEVDPALPGGDEKAPVIGMTVDASIPYKTSKAFLLEQFERAYVTDLLARHGGNITRAARAAEIDRVYLLRLLDKFGLRETKKS